MIKFITLCVAAMLSTLLCKAQLSGIKTIPGTYATIAAAITDLNTQGVGAGGVTFNIAAGYTETAPAGGYLLTATGTAANPIIFQKSGAGANPKVTHTGAGTVTTSTLGAQGDAIFTIQGSDYVSFNGIDVAATQSGIEYGYYLRKAGPTDGCKNVTILNAAITMTKGTSAYVVGIYSSNNSDASTASSATGITVTSVGGINENITFNGNTITNVFSGIIIRGYNAPSPYDLYDQNFTIGATGAGNTIQNYAGNTASSAYGVYTIYIKNANVSYNTIGNADNGGTTATSTLYGIFFSTNNALEGNNTANYNAISLSQGSTSGTNYIYNASTIVSFTAIGNMFSAGSLASTSTVYFIYNSNSTNTITVNNNRTVGTITKTGAGTVYGYYDNGSPTGGTATYSGNNFSNITLTGSSTFYGIYTNTSTSQTYVITSDTISNITGSSSTLYGLFANYGASNNIISGNNVSGLSGSSTIYGIFLGSTASTSLGIFNNTISNLTSTGASTVYGIYYANGNNTSIYKNRIYGLTANNASGLVYGITLAGGTSSAITNVYNNLIGDLFAPATSNTSDAIRGINIAGTSTFSTFNVYYNTVYLNATSTGANFSSSAIYHTVNTTSSTGTLLMLNNIFVNTSTPNGSGITAAFRRSGAGFGNFSTASNYNLYYTGTPSANRVVFYDGTTVSSTLNDYKTRVRSFEMGSVTEMPPFASTTPGTSNYLHITPGVITQLERAGIAITGFTDDIDNETRGAMFTDIGADEFSGLVSDLTPPTITHPALRFTCSVGDRTFTATITEPSGIPLAGAFVPRVYFRKGAAGTWYSAPGTLVSGNANISTWSFTISAATMGGLAVGDQVFYYLIAQDNVATPNVGSNPWGVVATNVNTVTTHPVTPNSYPIAPELNGTYTVGSGGNYSNLTNAVTGLNNSCLIGPVVMSLTDASYSSGETFPLVLEELVGSSTTNTVTFKPAAGVSPVVSANTSTLFKFNGSDNIIIDGSNAGSSRNLTWQNTNSAGTGTTVFWIGSLGTGAGANNITIKNSKIIGGTKGTTSTVSFGVFVGDATGAANGADNDNVTIANNEITNAYYAIQALGTEAGLNNNMSITGNTIGSNTLASTIGFTGILAGYATGANISNNTIFNVQGSIGYVYAISLSNGFVNSTVNANNIHSIKYTGTGGYGAFGIDVNTGTAASNITISNNMVSFLSGDAYSNFSSGGFAGIGIGRTLITGSINLYNNSVALNQGSTVSGFGSSTISLVTSALFIGGASTNIDVRNNILYSNVQFTNTAAAGSKTYAIYSAAPNTAFTNIDYNDYVVGGPQGVLGFIGTDRADIAAIQAGFGGNVNSKNIMPVFNSDTNLHLPYGSNMALDNLGTPIPGITTDIDGETRSTTTPDMGADEFGPPLPITLEYLKGQRNGTRNDLTWKVNCTSASITMVLERSADSRSFDKTIASITATQARCGQPFDGTDATPLNGMNYYRLKMIDIDGTVAYSPIVAILNGRNGAELVGIYPTIVTNTAYLSVTASRSTKMQISISDMSGKVISTINQTIAGGSSLLPINTSSLSAGVYNITGLLDGVRTQTLRFVKQ